MASLLRRSCSLAPARRAFSTSAPRLGATLQWDRNNKERLADTVPEYPYGAPRVYKQSRHGLYGEQRIRFGNNVSVKGKNKSRRSWAPNILSKRLFSKALNRFVQVRVSSRVLRTIDKLGGLDEYLLGEKETRIRELGESGWWLRWAIMQTPTVKKRFAAERKALGLPAVEEDFLVEEEDAEASAEASTPDAEIAELSLEENADLEAEPTSHVSEVMAEDDAFQIEQSKDLPPLRFRIGRNQYAMLTENGWRNLTRSPKGLAAAEELAKARRRSKIDLRIETEMASFPVEKRVAKLKGMAKEMVSTKRFRMAALQVIKERVKPATYADRVPKSLPRPTRHRVRPDLYDENGRRRVLREYTEYHTSRRRLTPAEQKTMHSDLSQKIEQAAKEDARDWARRARRTLIEEDNIRSGKTHRAAGR